MALQDTDNLIVQRGSTLNKVEIQNMATIQDTDLLVVGRGSESYKITGQEFLDSVGPKGTVDTPSIIAPADNAGEMVTAESDEITAYDPATKVLTLSGDKDLTVFQPLDDVQQDSGYTPQTSAITNVAADTPSAGETTLTLTDDTDLANFRVGDEVRQDLASGDIVFKDICPSAKAAPNGRIRYLDNTGTRRTIKPITDNGIQILLGSGSFVEGSSVSDSYLTVEPSGVHPENQENYVLELDCQSVAPFTISWRGNSASLGELVTMTAVTNCTLSGPVSTQNNIVIETVVTPISAGLVQVNIVDVNNRLDFGINYITGVTGLPIGTITAISGNTLTLNPVYGQFSSGNYVIGPATTPATGTVASTDPATNTMTLSVSDETFPKRWIVNQGKFVKGEETLSQDAAPDADGLTVQSSAFASTPAGALSHTTSDWQITLKTDTTYANPVDAASDSTDLTQWEPTGLEGDTAYRCRVRHKSGGVISEWSEDSTFKTADDLIPVSSPGDVYTVDRDAILKPITGPSLLKNVASNGARILAAGVDGKVYQALATDTAFTDMGISNIAAVACDGDAQDGSILTMARCATLSETFQATAYTTTSAGAAPKICPVDIKTIGCPGTYANSIYALPKDGSNEIYFFTLRDTITFLGQTSENAWGKVTVSGLPAGEKIFRIAAYGAITGYSADAILILCESGNLYSYAVAGVGNSALGIALTTSATLILSNVKDIACSGGIYNANQGVSALLNDGNVYWSNNQRSISWGLFSGVGKCRSPIFAGYTGGNRLALVLKDDGLLYGCENSTDIFTQLDYATNSVSTTPIKNLGSMVYSTVPDGKAGLIIPS